VQVSLFPSVLSVTDDLGQQVDFEVPGTPDHVWNAFAAQFHSLPDFHLRAWAEELGHWEVTYITRHGAHCNLHDRDRWGHVLAWVHEGWEWHYFVARNWSEGQPPEGLWAAQWHWMVEQWKSPEAWLHGVVNAGLQLFGSGWGRNWMAPTSRVSGRLAEIDTGVASTARGMRGGRVFRNEPPLLPRGPTYQEWDVGLPGPAGRGAERIVTGADGTAYYTPNHYTTFKQMR
jgi:hypothetical protein